MRQEPKKTLRLLLFEECNRKCRGCSNKSWDLKNLPVCEDYSGYDEVLITGGEPLLDVHKVKEAIYKIKEQNETAKIYVYTADVRNRDDIHELLYLVDGITLTLHTKQDAKDFYITNRRLSFLIRYEYAFKKKALSLRLNIFKNVRLTFQDNLHFWKIKNNITWIKKCPLPENETFMRYEPYIEES